MTARSFSGGTIRFVRFIMRAIGCFFVFLIVEIDLLKSRDSTLRFHCTGFYEARGTTDKIIFFTSTHRSASRLVINLSNYNCLIDCGALLIFLPASTGLINQTELAVLSEFSGAIIFNLYDL